MSLYHQLSRSKGSDHHLPLPFHTLFQGIFAPNHSLFHERFIVATVVTKNVGTKNIGIWKFLLDSGLW